MYAMMVSVPLFHRTHNASALPLRASLPCTWMTSSVAHLIAAGTTIAPMVPRERPGLAMRVLDGTGSAYLREGVRERLPPRGGRLERRGGSWYDACASSRCC